MYPSLLLFNEILICLLLSSFFFFNDTATTEIYTLSLHDALPISTRNCPGAPPIAASTFKVSSGPESRTWPPRSEEHTSELQSQSNLVCRLLLEKKKNKTTMIQTVSKPYETLHDELQYAVSSI